MMIRWGARSAIGLSLLLLGGVTCANGEPQDPADRRVAMTRRLHRGDAEGVELALAGQNDQTATFLLAEAAALRGRLFRADSLFAAAANNAGPLGLLAGARLAEIMEARGERARAVTQADRIAGSLEQGQATSADQWLALGIAYQVLGSERPAQFKDALAAYDRAVAADSSLIEGHLRIGQLFLDKYNAPDSRAAFGQALRREPDNARAQLGLALVGLFEGDPRSQAMLERAAAAGPGLGRVQGALARLDLDAESFDSAGRRADRALGLDSADLTAWGTRAARFLLQGDSAGFRSTEAAVRGWHRAPAPFYAEIAEALGRQRRYQAAATFAGRGVSADPRDPSALTALGVNQLRLGAVDSGRARLEQAFERDPYHVWNKNTLDLLDELAKYRTVASGRFVFVAAPEEIDLLTLYLAPLLEQAYDSLAARYRYRPPTPVRLEIYRRHADFSVRTVGLAGIGALGVSFGSVLAMDAPSARSVGDFNWASTAWHELTHAFTLGATDHRVPRWLSEGLSVLEERRARSGWGAQATIPFVSALKGGQLNPVSALNDGFVRPKRAADVGFAYYQASLLCEYLESVHGFDAILKLLDGYRRGLRTDQAVAEATGVPIGELGTRFDTWMKARFEQPLKGVAALRDSVLPPGEVSNLIETAKRLKAAGQVDQAIATLERADKLFPEMGDDDSPAWGLAELYRERGNRTKALEYLARVTRYNESQYQANRLEATLRAEAGDRRGAATALERAAFISPYDLSLHTELAGHASATGDHLRAVRERRAIVALNPSDRAGAFYELAVALRNAGDRAGARREVLKSLEEAPSFEQAQALLLELRGGTP